MIIPINFGEPSEQGTYVAYARSAVPGSTERLILVWFEGQWSYPLSDQIFRGDVIGHVGPLPPTMQNRWNPPA